MQKEPAEPTEEDDMFREDLFERNSAGRVVGLKDFVSVFPGRANSFRILFGGEVLKTMDELSGSAANLFMGDPDLTAVHVSEFVWFTKPLRADEAGVVVAKVVLVTDRIISVYIEVWGGALGDPENYTLRYSGFGQCAVLDASGAMKKDLEPYRDPSPIAGVAERVVEFQKDLRPALLLQAG
jgi:acyl-CoA hydrolase